MQHREAIDGPGASSLTATAPGELSPAQRWTVLVAAFLAWMFAGLEISSFVLLARPAMLDMLAAPLQSGSAEGQVGDWFAWFQCAFLLGAATGGWLFGWLGDRSGRTRAMALSILCYSVVTGISYFAADPYTLLALRFVACLGVGGVWPNAVSLAVEALPDVSRPLLAGLMGAAANVGFVLLGLICCVVPVTPESWRWVLLVGASPALLGLFALQLLPESPRWLFDNSTAEKRSQSQPIREILRPPLLSRTAIGICLGAIPVIGTSANANWLIPWADQAADRVAAAANTDAPSGDRSAALKPRGGDPRLKAWTQVTRSGGAIFGSLLGGWIASLLGRRLTYFFISLASFAISSYIYSFLDPRDGQFAWFAFLLGFVGVTYFGWLPLYLPELFPTRVRSTGTGVTFNSGRILAAASVLGAGGLMQLFGGDYARVGMFTGLIYAVGMLVICFAPDTTANKLEGLTLRTVGLIGLGLLGSALAERLLAAGFVVLGYDLSAERREELVAAGGRVADAAIDVARACDLIVLSLPDSNVVAKVIAQLQPAQRSGQLIVDTTTGDPAESAASGAKLAGQGVGFLDATIAGSSVQVRGGHAIVMAGGEVAEFDLAREILSCFGKEVFHVGPCGSGARMKLVVNLVLGLNRAVLAEGLTLARALNLDLTATLAILKASPAYSTVMDTKGEKMLSGDFAPQARLSQHLKDVGLILATGAQAGARLPLSSIHRQLLEWAEAAGLGGLDNSAVIRAFQSPDDQ